MLKIILPFVLTFFAAFSMQKQRVRLFDGKSFSGWEGDTLKTWRIEEGAIVGGSLTDTVPHNEFIATTKQFGNFVLQVKFRLLGTEGFVNSGVQFHSQRVNDPAYEMSGYQADLGDGYWGSLYDESRRNMKLVDGDSNIVKKVLRRGSWNDYEIRAENGHIVIKINGSETANYTETDKTLPQKGFIALQIHGGGKAQVSFKDIFITELP